MPTAPAVTTTRLQPFDATALPKVSAMPDRPTDGESLAVLLQWAAGCVWRGPLQPVPYYAVGHLEDWTYLVAARSWALNFGVQLRLDSPPYLATGAEYARELATYLLGRLAEAHVTVGAPQADYPAVCHVVLGTYAGDYPVRLESWGRLRVLNDARDGFLPDTAALWRWSAARKGSGPQASTVAARNLDGALATAQAMGDALACALPFASPEPPSTPRRSSSWR